MFTFYKHHPLKTIVDLGAEVNLIKLSVARQISALFLPHIQNVFQVDSYTHGCCCWNLTLSQDNKLLHIQALVKDLDINSLASISSMTTNDITICLAKHRIILNNSRKFLYKRKPQLQSPGVAYLIVVGTIWCQEHCTLWPSEYTEVSILPTFKDDSPFALELHIYEMYRPTSWSYHSIITSIEGKIGISNSTTLKPSLTWTYGTNMSYIWTRDHSTGNTKMPPFCKKKKDLDSFTLMPSGWTLKKFYLILSDSCSGYYTSTPIFTGIMKLLAQLKLHWVWDQYIHCKG